MNFTFQALSSSSSSYFPTLTSISPNSYKPSTIIVPLRHTIPLFHANAISSLHKFQIKATLDEKDQTTPSLAFEDDDDQQSQIAPQVEESVKVLKNAAKTRKVPAEDILKAFSVIEKAKLDPSGFLETLGGNKSPGRTWMLVFTAEKQLDRGRYFPITAVQRFDAAGKRIENGVYFGPIGCLTFEGRFTWKKRILAFIFECIRIKIGPLNPLEISLGQKDDREPSTKDPFFIWFYRRGNSSCSRKKWRNCTLGSLSTCY